MKGIKGRKLKKLILFIGLVFCMVACSNSAVQELQSINRLVSLNEESFSSEVTTLVNEVTNYNSEIGSFLSKCDVGVARDPGLDLFQDNEDPTCLILFIPNSLTHKEMLKEFAPADPGDAFTVALTKDIVGSDYPFIFIGEREFDFFYLTRVLAHEGFHAMSIKYQTECTETPMCEEVNAYKVQFKVLEEMYPQDLLNSGVKSYALSDSGELLLRALDMENFLYQKYKEGKLEQTLQEMSYGTN